MAPRAGRKRAAKAPLRQNRPLIARDKLPVIAMFVMYVALFSIATLAISGRKLPVAAGEPSPAVDPTHNVIRGDFVTISYENDCTFHVRLTATSLPDGSQASGTVVMEGFNSRLCQGRATGQITCLQLADSHDAYLTGVLTEATGVFSRGRLFEGVLRQDDTQTVGPLAGRAGFVVTNGYLQCPAYLSSFGPPILSGTIQISQALAQ